MCMLFSRRSVSVSLIFRPSQRPCESGGNHFSFPYMTFVTGTPLLQTRPWDPDSGSSNPHWWAWLNLSYFINLLVFGVKPKAKIPRVCPAVFLSGTWPNLYTTGGRPGERRLLRGAARSPMNLRESSREKEGPARFVGNLPAHGMLSWWQTRFPSLNAACSFPAA